MATRSAADRATTYVGGISPLGQRQRLGVVDSRALARGTVHMSAGRRGVNVELAPADLLALTGAATARVGRP